MLFRKPEVGFRKCSSIYLLAKTIETHQFNPFYELYKILPSSIKALLHPFLSLSLLDIEIMQFIETFIPDVLPFITKTIETPRREADTGIGSYVICHYHPSRGKVYYYDFLLSLFHQRQCTTL